MATAVRGSSASITGSPVVSRSRTSRLRSIEPPLAGTYRFEARLGDDAPRTFYVRTRTRPTTWWDVTPLDLDQSVGDEAEQARGYYLLSSGSLSADSLPIDCGPTRQMSREGYMAMFTQPDAEGEPRTWRGSIEVGLVADQFPADSALRRFERDEFERFSARSERGEPHDAPARFVLGTDGSVRVEQTLILPDGRSLRLAGERISRMTIAEPD